MPPHPRISLILPLHGVSYQQVRTYAAAAQAAGVSGLWFPDHLINETRPDRGVLECWTALAAVAATTEELPIGPLVLTTALRNPTLLAKQVATLDAIAPGRLRLGLGAGGLTYADTCKAYGLAELTPGERVAHCEETITCIRHLLTQEPADFQGRWTHAKGLRIHPRPTAPIPMIVAARRPGMLRMAARVADGWNCPLPHELSRGIGALEAAGRSASSIDVSVFAVMVIGATQTQAQRSLEQAGAAAQRFGDVAKHHLYGTPAAVTERILELHAQGADEITIDIRGTPLDESLDMLSGEVLPHLRASETAAPQH